MTSISASLFTTPQNTRTAFFGRLRRIDLGCRIYSSRDIKFLLLRPVGDAPPGPANGGGVVLGATAVLERYISQLQEPPDSGFSAVGDSHVAPSDSFCRWSASRDSRFHRDPPDAQPVCGMLVTLSARRSLRFTRNSHVGGLRQPQNRLGSLRSVAYSPPRGSQTGLPSPHHGGERVRAV